jgi:hypothetical protein
MTEHVLDLLSHAGKEGVGADAAGELGRHRKPVGQQLAVYVEEYNLKYIFCDSIRECHPKNVIRNTISTYVSIHRLVSLLPFSSLSHPGPDA